MPLPAALPSPFSFAQAGIELHSMWDVYRHTWLPFGGLLTDMEAVGMAVDRAHLAAAQRQAEADQAQAQERFRWVGGGA
jgi:DNA polymerase I-like protein with 3'-5' exonuclease and polymerase domains